MRRSIRQVASALLVAVVLLALASPAAAAPREEPARSLALLGPRVVSELLAWVGQWFGDSQLESVSAAAGGGMDPNGSAGSTEAEDDPGDSTTPQASHGMDPNG